MNLGKLSFVPVSESEKLVGHSVKEFLRQNEINKGVWVSEIDPELADTAAFCEHYDIGLEVSANCVIVAAKRSGKVWYAACILLATTRADINGVVRKQLDAQKLSFAPMDTAVHLSSMEYGGITPIGLPNDWPILIDENVIKQKQVIIGSGIRGSKILVSTDILVSLPNTKVLAITKP
jgi:prolyl-tRNA editing enzyme YbaK/EbsC (Cys-tRNA(Pro) deacylase)